MEVSPELAIAMVGFISSVGVAWGIVQTKTDAQGKENENIWRQITKVRDRCEAHEKDASETRLSYERRLGDLHSNSAKNDAQYDDLVRRFDSMEKKLDRLFENGDRPRRSSE